MVLVYRGGDVETFRPFRDRNRIVFGAHRGYVQLAIEAGVPILPVVSAGAHATLVVLDDGVRVSHWLGLDRWLRVKVFPTVLSIPWGLTVGLPPPYVPYPTRIYMEFLPPIAFDRSGLEAAHDHAYVERCHEQAVGAMQSALTRLAAERARDAHARNDARLRTVAEKLHLDASARRRLRRLAARIDLIAADDDVR
jgi:1-acyl-sn-glycerol-3-phosphate acyltransferase